MNGSIERLNNLIEYIEENLDKNLDYKDLAKILCVNEYSLHRIFYFITNVSLSEYIRKRKLSASCNNLLNGEKVIDVAIKYGYESATSFGRSFKKMMGFSPKDIFKNKKNLKILPVFDFSRFSKSFEEINYSIVNNISFNLYSISKKIPMDVIAKNTSGFWNKTFHDKNFIYEDKTYGIIEYDKYTESPDIVTYHVASTCPFKRSKNYKIENKSFLKFSIESRKADDINSFTKMIYACVIPCLEYNLDTLPDIEEYVGENTTNIYIPIIYNK